MKKVLLILFLSLMSVSLAPAQTSEPKAKKEHKSQKKMYKELQEFKLKFLAQEIDLKDNQKEQFTRLYTEMQEKREAVMRVAWQAEKKVKKDNNATEADYLAASEAMIKAKEEDAKIEKEYDKKFEKFLSSKQIFKLKTAEAKFRKKIEEMRHRHSEKKTKKHKD